MKQSIVKWLFELNAKQREVLARRFGLLGYEAATLEDVGREIGLTRERVRQIQVEGLRRLREILQTQGLNIEALFRSKYPCQKASLSTGLFTVVFCQQRRDTRHHWRVINIFCVMRNACG